MKKNGETSATPAAPLYNLASGRTAPNSTSPRYDGKRRMGGEGRLKPIPGERLAESLAAPSKTDPKCEER